MECPVPSRDGTRMGPNFFSWDGMGPNLCGMGAPGPMPSQDQDRDGTRPWWDGSSHPGPAASLDEYDDQRIKQRSSTCNMLEPQAYVRGSAWV